MLRTLLRRTLITGLARHATSRTGRPIPSARGKNLALEVVLGAALAGLRASLAGVGLHDAASSIILTQVVLAGAGLARTLSSIALELVPFSGRAVPEVGLGAA